VIKNLGGQVVGAEVVNAVTGAAFAGTVTVYVTGDGGTQAIGSVGSGLATNEGNGYYTYLPSQAETNFNTVGFTFTGTNAIPSAITYETITAAQAAALGSSTITAIGDGPTRIELLAQLAYRLNKTPPPNMDSATQARLVSYLNQRQRRLLTLPGIAHMREATVTFSSVASQPNYTLANIAKISRLSETTNTRVLYEMSQQDYRLVQPDTTITGTPEAFVWTGRQAVATQPADASALFVKSSSAADISATVYVEGIVTGGYRQTASVLLTGTTAVNVASTVSTWLRVDKFYLSAACVGTITLTEDSGGGTTLAVIPIGYLRTGYTGFALYPTPSSVITYTVDVTREITDLAQDTDTTVLPDDFSDVLVLGALADEYQHLSDDRWLAAVAEYSQRVKDLQYWLAESAIGRPLSLSRRWARPSQLGSYFPAGS